MTFDLQPPNIVDRVTGCTLRRRAVVDVATMAVDTVNARMRTGEVIAVQAVIEVRVRPGPFDVTVLARGTEGAGVHVVIRVAADAGR